MALSETDRQRIVAHQEAEWDSAFGGMDLSQFPSLQPAPPETSRDDGRFARHWTDTPLNASAAALRKFVSDPDSESLERVGNEIGNEEFRAEVRSRKSEAVAQAFKKACPDYLMTDSNYEAMVSTLAYNALPPADQSLPLQDIVALLTDQGYWSVPNLVATFNALSAEGLVDVPLGSCRELSTGEKLRVSRLAQSGHADQAIGEFLRYSLDGEEPTLDIVTDPDYRQVCDDAVWFVFCEMSTDFVPTAEREQYMFRHCAGRPVTLALLQSAWSACQANERRHERGDLIEQYLPEAQPLSPGVLDAMNDDQVNQLYKDSIRAYAESFRRAPGVLA